jgi:hypothetical protein
MNEINDFKQENSLKTVKFDALKLKHQEDMKKAEDHIKNLEKALDNKESQMEEEVDRVCFDFFLRFVAEKRAYG